MNRWLTVFSSAVAGLLLAGAPARADFVQWTYDWERSPIFVAADGSGTGGISFTNEPTKTATGSSDIVATNLRVFSSATPTNPDVLSSNGAYTLTLKLTDSTSGATTTLTFTGKLSGTFSATSSNIANAFTSPITQSVTLGQNLYTVVIGPYSPPGPPTASNAGSIAAHVTVTPNAVVASTTPEPSTLILAGLALSFGGGAAWRKRRNSLAAQLA